LAFCIKPKVGKKSPATPSSSHNSLFNETIFTSF
jgi:hypothetical protein